MNVKLRTSGLSALVLSLAVLGLAACASTPQKSADAPSRPSTVLDTDEAYIAYVERVARRRGIDVTWVNLPRVRTTVASLDE